MAVQTHITRATTGASVAYAGVTKRYGQVVALHPTSLAIEAGEFFSIIGPSGSGKTTLLGVTAGYIPPSGGQILINGEDVAHRPPFKRNLGMVFQNYALFPHMTVGENIAFPLRMRGLGRTEIDARVDRMLAMVHLADYAGRRPAELSGGQQQRVALARAAVYSPDVLLMDEPLSALDKNLREQMQDEVKELSRSLGITVLYVTHDQNEAAAMSDRLAVMNHGHIIQTGTPREIYEHPKNLFVASFLGEANLFEIAGVIDESPGRYRMRTREGFDIASSEAPPAGGATHVCVRPETLVIDSEPAIRDNSVPGRVVAATYAAGQVRYRVEVHPECVLVLRSPAGLREGALEPGSAVHVGWDAAASRLLREE